MKLTLDITDEKLLDQGASLRGDKSPEDFAVACFEQGLKLAEVQRRQGSKPKSIRCSSSRRQSRNFRTVEAAAITTALQENKQENPLTIEVNRLVNSYMAQLNSYARQNGNRLPAALQVGSATVPIQKVAFQITVESVRKMIEGSRGKAAAAD
jgi:hypothetical protein